MLKSCAICAHLWLKILPLFNYLNNMVYYLQKKGQNNSNLMYFENYLKKIGHDLNDSSVETKLYLNNSINSIFHALVKRQNHRIV